MDESAPPRAKQAKRSTPLTRLTAEERAKQFPEDLYADGGVLFCHFCEHSVDFTCVDTVVANDHLLNRIRFCVFVFSSFHPLPNVSTSRHVLKY